MAGSAHTASAARSVSCRYHTLARYSVHPDTARPLTESGPIELRDSSYATPSAPAGTVPSTTP